MRPAALAAAAAASLILLVALPPTLGATEGVPGDSAEGLAPAFPRTETKRVYLGPLPTLRQEAGFGDVEHPRAAIPEAVQAVPPSSEEKSDGVLTKVSKAILAAIGGAGPADPELPENATSTTEAVWQGLLSEFGGE